MVALPAAASLPVALPTSAGSPSTIEKIVGDLERLADRRAEALERLALRWPCRGENPAGLAAEAQQRAGLHRLQRPHLVFTEALRAVAGEAAFRGEIEHLAARHAANPGCAGQRAHQFDADRRHRDGFRAATGCRRRRSEGRRRRGWRSPRRISCARSAGRAADRRCPSPADRHGPANSSARIRAPRRPSARARRGTPNRLAALSTTKNGRNRLPPPRLA